MMTRVLKKKRERKKGARVRARPTPRPNSQDEERKKNSKGGGGLEGKEGKEKPNYPSQRPCWACTCRKRWDEEGEQEKKGARSFTDALQKKNVEERERRKPREGQGYLSRTPLGQDSLSGKKEGGESGREPLPVGGKQARGVEREKSPLEKGGA